MKLRYDKDNEELVITEATRIEYHQMDLHLTRHVKGYKFAPAFKIGVWNGKQSYFRNGKINLGLWKEALLGCQEIGVPFIIENKSDFPINREITLESVKSFCEKYFKDHKVKTKEGWKPFMPYEHQIESAFKILKNRFCMAEVATSGGKSLIISIVMFYTLMNIDENAKFLIIVPSITLVTQFYDNISEYNLGENRLEELKTNPDLNNDKYCQLRVEEVMSERPRKHSGTQNANVYIGTYQSLEKWPKEFFEQFHTVICDEAHGSKSKSVTTILKRTFGHAYSRFGVSGTFPNEDTCEILTIQSVLGPKITEVSANELREKGIITPMEIKAVVINHNDSEFLGKLREIRKAGMGKEALNIEKDYVHISEKRLDLIKKIVDKCDTNTLLLFHTIEYGKTIFDKLSSEISDKEFFYIDGEIPGKKREEIKKEMEKTKTEVEWTILNFGDYEIEVKSDFNMLLSNGGYKPARDITPDDDIDDNFLEKLKK
jgi:superfamily II DNA or RNA helicase